MMRREIKTEVELVDFIECQIDKDRNNNPLLPLFKEVLNSRIGEVKKKEVLRQLLKLSWDAVATAADYTQGPHSPRTQVCLEIARYIKKPHEAICRVLMPGVLLSGPGSELSGHEVTDDNYYQSRTEEEGAFPIENYTYEPITKTLIDVVGLFYYAKSDTDHLFAANRLPEGAHNTIRNIAGKVSQDYFDALLDLHGRKSEGTFGAALRAFADAVRRSSISGTGTDGRADMTQFVGPVQVFLAIWRDLPAKTRKSFKKMTKPYQMQRVSLHQIVSVLLAGTVDCPDKLTQDEKEAMISWRRCQLPLQCRHRQQPAPVHR